MYNREISCSQLTAWLAAALIPTVIQLTAGAPWLSVLLAGILSLLCVFLRWQFGTEPGGKFISFLQWGLLIFILAAASRQSQQSWPDGGHPAVAMLLLLLAAWSAWKGPSASARVGSVLFWFVLVLYLILLGAGVKDVQIQWLKPIKGDAEGFACVLMLTPAAATIHLYKREVIKPRLLLITVFSTVAAVVTAGVLSPEVAASKDNAFYEMTRSLNLLGQARRFEAVLSAGMTVGWFSLLNLYLTNCSYYAEKLRTGWGRWGILVSAATASAVLLCDLHIPALILLILTAVFWVLLPLLTQGLGTKKKS